MDDRRQQRIMQKLKNSTDLDRSKVETTIQNDQIQQLISGVFLYDET